MLYRRCTDHFAKLSNELGGGEWVDGYLLSRYVPLVRFRAEKRRRRVGRTTLSLSLCLDDRKTPLPSNFSIKHSRDAKFGREEILARVSSAPASSPTCRFLFIRPGESPAGARLCWLRKKKKGEKKRTRTSISRTRGKLYYLDAQLTKKKKEERKGQIISTFKLQSWKGTALVSTLVLENCLSVLNSGRHLRKVGRKISFSPLSTMIYFYSNFSLPV